APNGNQLRQLDGAAFVIGMKVCDEEVVDLSYAGVPSRSEDPPRITGLCGVAGLGAGGTTAGPSSIDEKGLLIRCNEQRGLSALHVDEVDVKCAIGRPVRYRQRHQ